MRLAILDQNPNAPRHAPKALTMIMMAVLVLGVFAIAFAPTAEAKSAPVTISGTMTGVVVDLGKHTIDLKGEGGSVLLPLLADEAKVKLETEAVIDSASITVAAVGPTDPGTGLTPAAATGLTGEGELKIKGKDASGNKLRLEASWTVTAAAGIMLGTNDRTFLPAMLNGAGSAEIKVGKVETPYAPVFVLVDMSGFTSATPIVTVAGFTDAAMTSPLFSAVVNLKKDKESYEGTVMMGTLAGDLTGAFTLTTNSKGDLTRGVTKEKGEFAFTGLSLSGDPLPDLDGKLKGKTTGLPDFAIPGAVTSEGKFVAGDDIMIVGTYDMTWLGPYGIVGAYAAKVHVEDDDDDDDGDD